MQAELTVLALGAVLALVHILAAAHAKTEQYGVAWNTGARDEDLPPLNKVAGRLDRARGNFLETFPLAIVAFGGVVLAGKAGPVTAAAAWIWLAARIVYLPLYWTGVPKVRTLVWGVSLLALIAGLGVLLFGSAAPFAIHASPFPA